MEPSFFFYVAFQQRKPAWQLSRAASGPCCLQCHTQLSFSERVDVVGGGQPTGEMDTPISLCDHHEDQQLRLAQIFHQSGCKNQNHKDQVQET